MDGGWDSTFNDAALYIARVRYNDGVHTAKIGGRLSGAHLAFSGTEVNIDVCTNSMTCSVSREPFTDTLAATELRSVVPQLKRCTVIREIP